jgi:hypothetical protein
MWNGFCNMTKRYWTPSSVEVHQSRSKTNEFVRLPYLYVYTLFFSSGSGGTVCRLEFTATASKP